jgi:hypothetical protein
MSSFLWMVMPSSCFSGYVVTLHSGVLSQSAFKFVMSAIQLQKFYVLCKNCFQPFLL